jgi:hypothetical protein
MVRDLGVVEDPRSGLNAVRGGFGGPWSKSADRAVARRTIFCRNVQQNTARIARTAGNVAFCRTFLRSVFTVISTCADGFVARSTQIATADRTDRNQRFSRSFLHFKGCAVGAVATFPTFTMGS